MADGCINTHMARLLGAPPLLDINFREDRRKKEVEDLISKYAKKKDKDEVMTYLVQL